MKLLDGSGASTKINAVYNVMKIMVLEKGFKPDYISGVSASAILGIPVAMSKWNVLDKELSNFNLDTIFSQKPVNDKNKITLHAIGNIIKGNPYLGKMGNLESLYRKIVTEFDFELYKNHNFPPVYVSSIDYKTGARNIVNLKDVDYETMIKNVIASASIPIFVEPVKINDMILFDGGVRDHSIAYYMMKNIGNITNVVSIFSRPKNNKLNLDWDCDKVTDVAMRTIEIFNTEISKTDEEQQRDYAELKNIKLTQIFLPSLTKGMYDVDKNRLDKLKDIAIEIAKETRLP